MSQPQSASQPDYSWAEYLDYMEGGGSDVVSLPAAKPAAKKEQPLWGALLALGVTLAAFSVSELPFRPFTLAGGRHPIATPSLGHGGVPLPDGSGR